MYTQKTVIFSQVKISKEPTFFSHMETASKANFRLEKIEKKNGDDCVKQFLRQKQCPGSRKI